MIIIKDKEQEIKVYEDENGIMSAVKTAEDSLPWANETCPLDVKMDVETRNVNYIVSNEGSILTIHYHSQKGEKAERIFKQYDLKTEYLVFGLDIQNFFEKGIMPVKEKPNEGPLAYIGDNGFIGEVKTLIVVTAVKNDKLKTTVGFIASSEESAAEMADSMKKSDEYCAVFIETYTGDFNRNIKEVKI